MIKSKKDRINYIIYDSYIVFRGEEKNKSKGIKIDNYREKSLDIKMLCNLNLENLLNYLTENKIKYSIVEFL